MCVHLSFLDNVVKKNGRLIQIFVDPWNLCVYCKKPSCKKKTDTMGSKARLPSFSPADNGDLGQDVVFQIARFFYSLFFLNDKRGCSWIN